MGIATKRRDNARKLVAEIYGGALEIILKDGDIDAAKKYFRTKVKKLLTGGFSLDELIVTKSVKSGSSYVNPTSIAPRVLADRMCERDPGNKVMSNERLPYVFIDTCNLKCHRCNSKIHIKACKCIKCMHYYCKSHLKNHRQTCVWKCRFCKEKHCPVMGNARAMMKIQPTFEVLEFDDTKDIIDQIQSKLNCIFFAQKRLFKCNTCTGIY